MPPLDRRDFLNTVAVVGTADALGSPSAAQPADRTLFALGAGVGIGTGGMLSAWKRSR